jgi:2-polyprenyl-3-methyl-5-hydroxy-6-metoxy-1,4-benzoquinol methylase
MELKKCRNCNSTKLKKLFSLGKQSFTGKFIQKSEKVKKDFINLSICESCKLVQLKNKYNLKYMYGPDYGYRTGINKTMTNHVKNVTSYLSKISKIKPKDYVLDIASNDGTLLNSYNNKIVTFGIDPILNKYKKYYKNINFYSNNFFSKKKILLKTKKKFKIITALSVFYDLKDPNKFLKDVYDILHDDGFFLLEFADLASLIEFNMFDTICHEHAEYYSTEVLIKMFKKNNFKLITINQNNINGSSKQYLLVKSNSKIKINMKMIKKIVNYEKKLKLDSFNTYKKFFNKIINLKNKLNFFLKKQTKLGKIIHGYGASTKGNTLLQFYKTNRKYIRFIADRNPDKFGLKTPGTNIKIISEEISRSYNPDYYLVLPWHFKEEILKREKRIRKKGTKFIFPLPTIKIY